MVPHKLGWKEYDFVLSGRDQVTVACLRMQYLFLVGCLRASKIIYNIMSLNDSVEARSFEFWDTSLANMLNRHWV